MQGPSPLLPAWLNYWLQPARAAWSRGLKAGASPLLLPKERLMSGAAQPAMQSRASGSERLQVSTACCGGCPCIELRSGFLQQHGQGMWWCNLAVFVCRV